MSSCPPTPTISSPAPRTRNFIARDVNDPRQIDTSEPPDPHLYPFRIADAMTRGKPQVIVFATHEFGASRHQMIVL
jgi:hypothetical protein